MTARLHVRVTPRSRRSEVVGPFGEAWKVRVAAPPDRGRANEVLLELLAGVLGVRRGCLKLVAGAGSRDKVIEVEGLTTDDARRLLESGGEKGEG